MPLHDALTQASVEPVLLACPTPPAALHPQYQFPTATGPRTAEQAPVLEEIHEQQRATVQTHQPLQPAVKQAGAPEEHAANQAAQDAKHHLQRAAGNLPGHISLAGDGH